MKFIFKNLGPINEAELELGDLTIIAGRNNTGKTYVAYALYGFLKMWETILPPPPPEMKKMVQELDKEAVAAVFSSSLEDFESASVEVEVVKDEFGLPFPRPFILSAERFGISLFYKELDFTKNRLVEIVQEFVKELGFTKNRLVRALQEAKKDREKEMAARFLPFLIIDKIASRYAMPIKDNIDYTRSIPDLQKHRSELYDSKLFEGIENMMKGYYRSSGDDIRFKSKARKGGFDIPLYTTSSSARGLSDLYFFLRHVAKKNQLLIIDEPESHLDTANQIQLARLLARAVHAGLKVLITTHSDYIVKEINNLLMLSESFKDKPKVLKKYKYSEHDFLKPDSVRAYVAESNSLTQCPIEKYGIDMPVFDTTIDAINRVSSELESRLTYEGEE